MTAAALLGAFLFLLVASFLALPCMTTAASSSGLFSSVAGPQACEAPKLFVPRADIAKFEALPAEGLMKSLVALPALLPSVVAAALLVAAALRPGGSRSPRVGTLPFVTSDPPWLPAFAALRDA